MMMGVIEGLLFLAGDDGISTETFLNILEIDENELNELIQKLSNKYSSEEHGIRLEFLGGKYKLVSKKEYKEYYQKLVEIDENDSLSQAALETLAIIAYNQPITRNMVDEIRGVNSSHIIRKLLIKNLIQEVGRSELPGRPILYGTTPDFLDYFGLGSIDELPKIEFPETIDEETYLFDSRYKEDE